MCGYICLETPIGLRPDLNHSVCKALWIFELKLAHDKCQIRGERDIVPNVRVTAKREPNVRREQNRPQNK